MSRIDRVSNDCRITSISTYSPALFIIIDTLQNSVYIEQVRVPKQDSAFFQKKWRYCNNLLDSTRDT